MGRDTIVSTNRLGSTSILPCKDDDGEAQIHLLSTQWQTCTLLANWLGLAHSGEELRDNRERKHCGATFGEGHYALMWDLMWTGGAYPATSRGPGLLSH
jgi:hypothetical protein